MDSLIRDCDKLAKHQLSSTQKSLNSIDLALQALQTAKQSIQTPSTVVNSESLVKAKSQIDKTQALVSDQLRELYTNVSKYGKHVEKTFKLDLSVVSTSRAFEDKRLELGQAVLQHFLREGDFELARGFAEEAQLEVGEEAVEGFEEMYGILKEIRGEGHVLEGAVRWAVQRRTEMEGLGLALEFALHRLRFLQLVELGDAEAALRYAREWFPLFAHQREHMDEIEHLMGIFIYARRLQSSPYAAYFAKERWDQGARLFAAAFCAVRGLASVSPLGVSVDAGASALPVVCKVQGLMRDRRVEWSQQNELAVEVPLPDAMRFHSVFACPVSKEQTSPENPPMAMPCGHVVCRASLEKLSRGLRPGTVASGRFKCPYCPAMSTMAEAKKVHF
ncbi:hypothetical protein GGF37_001086 [Kickxella alabastrina]|nr:hypothetical protein GGF37_001086 [Kickxella alabastrina]